MPLREARPIPPKYPNGIETTKAHGQLITKDQCPVEPIIKHIIINKEMGHKTYSKCKRKNNYVYIFAKPADE